MKKAQLERERPEKERKKLKKNAKADKVWLRWLLVKECPVAKQCYTQSTG